MTEHTRERPFSCSRSGGGPKGLYPSSSARVHLPMLVYVYNLYINETWQRSAASFSLEQGVASSQSSLPSVTASCRPSGQTFSDFFLLRLAEHLPIRFSHRQPFLCLCSVNFDQFSLCEAHKNELESTRRSRPPLPLNKHDVWKESPLESTSCLHKQQGHVVMSCEETRQDFFLKNTGRTKELGHCVVRA